MCEKSSGGGKKWKTSSYPSGLTRVMVDLASYGL